MGRRHEKMNPDEKARALEDAVKTFRFLVENHFQGNITFPVYDGVVGKIKAELFMMPALIPSILDGTAKGGNEDAVRNNGEEEKNDA